MATDKCLKLDLSFILRLTARGGFFSINFVETEGRFEYFVSIAVSESAVPVIMSVGVIK